MMKRIILLSVSLLLIIGINVFAEDADYKSDQIFVRFGQINGQVLNTTQKSTVLSTTLSGSRIMKNYSIVPGLSLIQLPDGVDVPSALSKINKSKLITYAEPVYYCHLAATIPNDTYFPLQWGLNNTGQFGGTKNADINAPEAWDTYKGSSTFVVAVLDTGIDFNHPDLKANIWHNTKGTPDYNGIDTADNDYDPCDTLGHGTHVAGIIGAVANNNMGVAGVNWNVKLMTVKVFPDRSETTSIQNIIAGIQYVVDKKNSGVNVRVINASLARPPGSPELQAEKDAIAAAARDAGILFVAAAGNDLGNNNDSTPVYPASYDLDNIISVMATDQFDNRAYFSNYGAENVDLAAPGEDILSTTPTRDINIPAIPWHLDPNYAFMSGTSMATPYVAGACAFVWSFDSANLDYKTVRDAVLYSSTPKNSLKGLSVTGGRLNLKAALDAVNAKVINTRYPTTIYHSIQKAIDGTTDKPTMVGDIIIAQNGYKFFEAIDFKGKKITLRSGDITHISDANLHPENTYIMAQGKNTHAVTFQTGEVATTAIKGFTITKGFATGSTMFDRFGGGIYCSNTSPLISDCNIVDNGAYYDGGAIYCDDDANPTIANCTIKNNAASSRDGGGIYCYDSSPTIRNCLIVGNLAARDGGGIYFNGSSPTIGEPTVVNCTIVGNSANSFDGLGGGIYCYYYSKPVVKDCIFVNNPNYAIFDEDADSYPILTFSMFYNNPDGDYYDAYPPQPKVYTGGNVINNILDGRPHNNNMSGDPLFARGRLGGYYLSQTEAGQLSYSTQVVNAGSTTAILAGMNIYSTRTDNVKDSGQVDIGFHYNDRQAVVNYKLRTFVDPNGKVTIDPNTTKVHTYKQFTVVRLLAAAVDPNKYQFKTWQGTDDDSRRDVDTTGGVRHYINTVTMDANNKQVTAYFEPSMVSLVTLVTTANGSINRSPAPDDPRRDLYTRGTVVTLTAVPDNPSYRVKWTGTDDDLSSSLVNKVTMYTDREVFAEFYAPRMFIVGGGGEPGAYTNLGEAIEDSRNGDVIQIHEGEWYNMNFPFIVDGKAITIRSTNPDDPCVVAKTILHNWIEFENVGRDTVLSGVTIRDINYICVGISGDGIGDITNVDFSDCDGFNGGSSYGGGIIIGLFNQVNELSPGYYSEVSPTIINCVIKHINLPGCDGGNGVCSDTCSGPGDGGWGGKAYGGGVYIGPDCKPLFKNVTIRDCNVIGGDGGNAATCNGVSGYAGSWGDPTGATNNWWFGPYDEVWKYSGHGGGAYCDVNSAPVFIDCNFIGNTAQGGSSGLAFGPSHNRIDSYGAAVYCAAKSSSKFTNCRFVDNVVDLNGVYPLWRWSPKVTIGTENLPVIIWDKYFGYGGAVAGVGHTRSYEGFTIEAEGGQPVFEGCTFINNRAPNGTGGAMHWMQAFEIINKSTFTNNNALHGGALYLVNGKNQILESAFTGNQATDTLGEGGAIFAFDANTIVADSDITDNIAVASGGGIYIAGPNTLLKNDLISGNFAGRDGGGVSANVYADVNIVNSTIADNRVGGSGFGGGVYCYYNSFVNIIDSILYGNQGNVGASGLQLAISTGDQYDPVPSTIKVQYSDVQGATDPNSFGKKIKAIDFVFCIDSTGSMADDIDAVKAAANLITADIAAKIPDYRIAVVDFRDFNQPNPDANLPRYGWPEDYPYRTDTTFTKDAGTVAAALSLITAAGGSDGPSSSYTGLMHCIDNNSLMARLGGNLYGASAASKGPGGWRSGNVLRVIILMGDAPPHDPEPFTNYRLADIVAAAVDGNKPKIIVPVLIGGASITAAYFQALADQTGGVLVNADGPADVVAGIRNAITLISKIPDPLFIGNGGTLNWNPTTRKWLTGTHNIDKNPLFAEGYFLSQKAAGQSIDSNCVDTGNITAQKAGLYRHTTRTDLVVENLNSIVDLGYHYVRNSEFLDDLNYDGIVDENDVYRFTDMEQYPETGCGFPDWCQGKDLNRDGIVNGLDYAIVTKDAQEGLKVEKTPPMPNPMTWEIVPTSAPGLTSITMTATKAKDAYGGPIKYCFQRTNASGAPDVNSGWVPNRVYTNSGLTTGTTYGYEVKARDARGNETDFSVIGYAKVGTISPPTAPIGLTATTISASQIDLTWTDTSSSETGFKIQRKTGTGLFATIATVGANVTSYSSIGLTSGTTYNYQVIATNSGGDSSPSNQAAATTLGGGVSTEPNQPVMISGASDPNSTQTKEGDPNTGVEYWYHTVVASVPNIGGGRTVWFRFVCNGYSGFSSPWISSANTFPLRLTHPISSAYPTVLITVSGTTVTYKIAVKQGGSFGWTLDWQVCASFNANGSNSACSGVLTIPTH
jgi:subtilisin family serine protease